MSINLITGVTSSTAYRKLSVKRLHPDAIIPKYQTAGAACFDLHAIVETVDGVAHVCHEQPVNFRIGLAFEVPTGWVMKVYSRSGHGFKHNIRLVNGTGIIDSDFRGEMRVALTCDQPGTYLQIKTGDRIAQCMLEPAPQWHLQEVDELSETARGTNGFGSTGS